MGVGPSDFYFYKPIPQKYKELNEQTLKKAGVQPGSNFTTYENKRISNEARAKNRVTDNLKSSARSKTLTLSLVSDLRNPLPIDCKFLILDLVGEDNTTLLIFLMLIPVEKVP